MPRARWPSTVTGWAKGEGCRCVCGVGGLVGPLLAPPRRAAAVPGRSARPCPPPRRKQAARRSRQPAHPPTHPLHVSQLRLQGRRAQALQPAQQLAQLGVGGALVDHACAGGGERGRSSGRGEEEEGGRRGSSSGAAARSWITPAQGEERGRSSGRGEEEEGGRRGSGSGAAARSWITPVGGQGGRGGRAGGRVGWRARQRSGWAAPGSERRLRLGVQPGVARQRAQDGHGSRHSTSSNALAPRACAPAAHLRAQTSGPRGPRRRRWAASPSRPSPAGGVRGSVVRNAWVMTKQAFGKQRLPGNQRFTNGWHPQPTSRPLMPDSAEFSFSFLHSAS